MRPSSVPAGSARAAVGPELPALSVDWKGALGDGVTEAPPGIDPSAAVEIDNRTSAAMVIGFDVFVLSSDPSTRRDPSKPLPYAAFSTGVWDWRVANPGTAPTMTVAAMSSARFSLVWARARQNGTAVPAGKYFLLLPYTINGAPGRYAETTYLLS
ncbi:MAG: hypothetical protein ACRENL_02485 [Candidatus Dormibacteria bacterium]